jgi:uncharacterized protein YjbI with pentapeptide repeats
MRWPGWLGVAERRWKKSPDEEVQPPKTVWDFLQLLIVPAILVVVALAFNASQASRERQREDRQVQEDRALAAETRRDANLDAYLTEMRDLILNRQLLTSRRGSAVQSVARTATLTAVRRLDGRRKGEVIRFLAEAGLLDDPIVILDNADLRDANLANARLGDVVLGGDLRGARFDDTELNHVDFGAADLSGASFRRAVINSVDFSYSNLTNGVFNHSFIMGTPRPSKATRSLREALRQDPTTFLAVCLNNASFAHARIFGADFGEAGGRDVDFSYVKDLRSLSLEDAFFDTARLTGVRWRPEGWPSTGDQVHLPKERNVRACRPHSASEMEGQLLDTILTNESRMQHEKLKGVAQNLTH